MSIVLTPPSINEASVAKEVVISKSNYVTPSLEDQVDVFISNKIIEDLFSGNADFIEYSLKAMNRLS